MAYVCRIRPNDTLVLTPDSGGAPTIVRIRRVTSTELRLVVIAPDSVGISHGSRGDLIAPEIAPNTPDD